jgi:hypothetical protein
MAFNTMINYSSFGILSLLWLGFGVALLFNHVFLDSVWQLFRGLPVAFQVVIGLLLLPVVLGLWIWETPWPLWIRLVLVIGLGWATLYTFFPKQA